MDNAMIDRTTYKKIKSMNRTEMNAFLTELLTDKAEQQQTTGEPSSLSELLAELRSAIADIKGIGDVKLNAIMDTITEVLGGYDFKE